ncbi:S-adenosylmethionine:tRNA ribosyltransferase-isomerase [bacterium SCSIO 12741]|nr:S-adenosylmethionine:tRNA ribosyltransferase-isomerase [bacterium SCSIO 12741]
MNPEEIRIADFQYPLPEDRIAKYPLEKRDESKLLVFDHGNIVHKRFPAIVEEIPEGTLLLFNNTRVIHARLKFYKETGARIEIFCLEPHGEDPVTAMAQVGSCSWNCLVGNAKKWKSGTLELKLPSGMVLRATCEDRSPGNFLIRFDWDGDVLFSEILEEAGEIPLPPYLNRKAESEDKDRYQTVYSKIEGSVAAPTAGLHFTPSILEQLGKKGVEIGELTLHVSAGTFQPVKADQIGDHPMHYEYFTVQEEFIQKLIRAVENGRPIIAVGTTSLRALESLFWLGAKGGDFSQVDQWDPYRFATENTPLDSLIALSDYMAESGSITAQTGIMIAPGYTFQLAQAIVTNFHMPQSTLLLLISAMVGGQWRKIYEEALAHDYRFLSYGDSSLLWHSPPH